MTTVSTDDLVNSLLQSVTTTSSQSTDSDSLTSISSASASSSASNSGNSSKQDSALSPATKVLSPTTTGPAALSPIMPSDSTPETVTEATNDDGGGAGLAIGITIGVLVLVIAALLFVRSRRKRTQKQRKSVHSPPTGSTCLTVPAHRGFKKEHELGMPEMSIELSPGDLGLSKGFDMSYASSTRTSTASNQFNSSVASTDSSVFNTKGGLSPTFSSRKMASYSYHYRASEENGNANPHLASSTTFHLTGMIGNGQASGRGGNFNSSRAPGGRKLSAPDEYAELVTATNAHGKMDMDLNNQTPHGVHADFTQSTTSENEMDISMGPDADNHSFLAPLPTRAAPTRPTPTVARASEESMGPDSPVAGRGKRTGSVYDTIPHLAGEKMSASSLSSEDPHAMSAASFLSESSISSTSTRDSFATTAHGSAYVSSIPLLQQSSDYSEDNSFERASTESSGSANTARSGSLIALNLEAKGGNSEIAI